MVSNKTLLMAMDILILFVMINALLIMVGIKSNNFDYNTLTGLAIVAAVMSFYNFIHQPHDKEEETTSS